MTFMSACASEKRRGRKCSFKGKVVVLRAMKKAAIKKLQLHQNFCDLRINKTRTILRCHISKRKLREKTDVRMVSNKNIHCVGDKKIQFVET